MAFIALFCLRCMTRRWKAPPYKSGASVCAHDESEHVSDYAADMNLLLSYYKCLDDWTDERKWKGRSGGSAAAVTNGERAIRESGAYLCLVGAHPSVRKGAGA
ncbi:MAG: DUF5685 family protein [Gallintestinimicrobium sp.]